MNQKFISAVIVTMPLLTSGNAYSNSSTIQVAEANKSYSISRNARRQIDNRISIPSNTNRISGAFVELPDIDDIFAEWQGENKKNKINGFTYPKGANPRDSFRRHAPNYR